MRFYPTAITLSQRNLQHLSDLIRHGRDQRRSRWRRLSAGDQALLVLVLVLVLAHLRNGDTHARLGAGFGVSTPTAWRYVQEGIDLLAPQAQDLAAVMTRAARLAHAVLDGTLIPIDRVGMATGRGRPYYSGKHHRHGVNVQALADPAGRPVFGLSGPARRRARPDRGPCPRPDRRPGQRGGRGLRRPWLPRCWGLGPHPVQAPSGLSPGMLSG